MAVKLAKQREQQAYRFNTLHVFDFAQATVAAAAVNTAVVAKFPLTQATKIAKIAVDFDSISALDGSVSFNIVVGKGVSNGLQGPPDNFASLGVSTSLAVAGNQMFAKDVQLTVLTVPGATVAAGGTVVFDLAQAGSNEVIYPAGTVLTLRATTPAATGAIAGLKVVMLAEVLDLSINTSDAITSANPPSLNF